MIIGCPGVADDVSSKFKWTQTNIQLLYRKTWCLIPELFWKFSQTQDARSPSRNWLEWGIRLLTDQAMALNYKPKHWHLGVYYVCLKGKLGYDGTIEESRGEIAAMCKTICVGTSEPRICLPSDPLLTTSLAFRDVADWQKYRVLIWRLRCLIYCTQTTLVIKAVINFILKLPNYHVYSSHSHILAYFFKKYCY